MTFLTAEKRRGKTNMKAMSRFFDGCVDFCRRCMRMFRDDSIRPLESVLAWIVILWGGYQLMPSLWGQYDLSRAIFQRLPYKDIWAAAMIVAGQICFVADVYDIPRWRRRGIRACALFFAAISTVYWIDSPGVGRVLIPFFAIVSAGLYIRLDLQMRSVKFKQEADSGGHENQRGGSIDVGDGSSNPREFSDRGREKLVRAPH
jgi:hypothetical protein